MHKLMFAMSLILLTNTTAGAQSITDDESANDSIGTAGIQIPHEADPNAHVGVLSLIPGDVDFVGLGSLGAGDVITAATTPLASGDFFSPDTVLGIFDAAGSNLAFNDDAGGIGYGSAIALVVPSAGDYFVGVSGYGDDTFEGFHSESGDYVLTISVAPVPAPNEAPDCSAALGTPDEIWPLDRRMVDVSIAGVTDPDGDAVSLTVDAIFQDESHTNPSGSDSCGDAAGVGTGSASVRAASNGNGDGRVYSIDFTATDPSGAACSSTVTVCVPHDQGEGSACVDQGPLFDSTACSS